MSQPLTRMVWVIAFSSPDSLVISSISLCDYVYSNLLNFLYHDYSCCRDKVNMTAGRRAVVIVFAPDSYRESSGQFYLDVTNPYHLSGLSHLDNFIVTRKSYPPTGTLQKHMPTPTPRLRRGRFPATPHTTGPVGKKQNRTT